MYCEKQKSPFSKSIGKARCGGFGWGGNLFNCHPNSGLKLFSVDCLRDSFPNMQLIAFFLLYHSALITPHSEFVP